MCDRRCGRVAAGVGVGGSGQDRCYSRGRLGEGAAGTCEQHQEVEGEARQGPSGAPHGGGAAGGGGGFKAITVWVAGQRARATLLLVTHQPWHSLGLDRLASLTAAGDHLEHDISC